MTGSYPVVAGSIPAPAIGGNMARLRKYSDEDVERIKKQLSDYIASVEIPILAEFAYTHGVARSTLYEYEELSTLLKQCIEKKEAQLERKALEGDVNTTMAIFSLKQLGWRDKHDVEHTGAIVVQFDDALKDV